MNFIIYEDEKAYSEKYKKVILKLFGPTNFNYTITQLYEYNKNTEDVISKLEGNKIYILDIEVPGKNGLELARKIRKNGDWTSPIIIVTSHEEFKQVGYTAKILMLNFITKNKELEKDLGETLEVALEINLCNKALCYTSKGEMYHIPYQDILYIEKNINDNNCNVITKNNTYNIRDTIIDLEKKLSDDINFVKTHRSCIINLKNVKHIDFENNIIEFSNKKTNLLSRSHKKILKDKMRLL